MSKFSLSLFPTRFSESRLLYRENTTVDQLVEDFVKNLELQNRDREAEEKIDITSPDVQSVINEYRKFMTVVSRNPLRNQNVSTMAS